MVPGEVGGLRRAGVTAGPLAGAGRERHSASFLDAKWPVAVQRLLPGPRRKKQMHDMREGVQTPARPKSPPHQDEAPRRGKRKSVVSGKKESDRGKKGSNASCAAEGEVGRHPRKELLTVRIVGSNTSAPYSRQTATKCRTCGAEWRWRSRGTGK